MTSSGISNWPAPARLTVGIISAGRVGTALGAALEAAGHVVGAVVARSAESTRRAAQRLPESQVLDVPGVAARSELLILSVPDSSLDAVIGELAASDAVRPGTIVAHTAGARGVSALAPLSRLGATPIAIHPAMTFVGTDDDLPRLRSACFGVTAADEVGFAVASSLVIEMGGEPVQIRESARPLYHAALAHGANHLVALVSDALDMLGAAISVPAGMDADPAAPVSAAIDTDDLGGLPARILGPLAAAALQNTLELGPSALTGPVARGDAPAVAEHLRALADGTPEMVDTYRAMSRRAASRVRVDVDVRDVLGEGSTGGGAR